MCASRWSIDASASFSTFSLAPAALTSPGVCVCASLASDGGARAGRDAAATAATPVRLSLIHI
eukprot:3421828-Prymnesium_polylepis.1